jgi:Sap, sulfolipid-1-addressing protein
VIALVAMAIGFGAIVAFSPTKLAIVILYLSGGVAPVARAVAFTIGNTAVIGAVAIITYAGGLVVFDDPSSIPPTASDWLDIAIGMVLLAIGAYGLARPGSVSPSALGVGSGDLRPRLGRAFAFGASYGFVAFGRLLVVAAGGSWISRSPIGPTGQVVLLVVMLVVAQMPLWLPIAMHVFAPSRMERLQGFADRGVQQIGGRAGASIVACIGGLLVLSGLRWLL